MNLLKTRNTARHVLYIDRSIIVLNKPPGLTCQPSSKRAKIYDDRADDFVNLLKDLRKELGMSALPYTVHRLDKPTTGTWLLARSAVAARELSHHFRAREVEKSYLALVRAGAKSFERTSGEIRATLQTENGRVSLSPSPEGNFAATDWELIASAHEAPVSLLRLRPHTGLKHQIRVHLAQELKAPIVGDTLYSRTALSDAVNMITDIPDDRLFLHASTISFFRYRKTGPKKRFRFGISAPLPPDFAKVCQDLDIPIERHELEGGLFVDGVAVKDDELGELGGRWMS